MTKFDKFVTFWFAWSVKFDKWYKYLLALPLAVVNIVLFLVYALYVFTVRKFFPKDYA